MHILGFLERHSYILLWYVWKKKHTDSTFSYNLTPVYRSTAAQELLFHLFIYFIYFFCLQLHDSLFCVVFLHSIIISTKILYNLFITVLVMGHWCLGSDDYCLWLFRKKAYALCAWSERDTACHEPPIFRIYTLFNVEGKNV